MRIANVELRSYTWPRPTPIRNGRLTYTHTGINLVHLHTGTGLTGIGWGGTVASTGFGAVQSALLDQFRPALIGADPFTYRRIWHDLWQPKVVGRRGISTHVISAIDIALWDLMGKATGKSLHQLLGGYRDRVPTYAPGGYYAEGKGLDGLAEEVRGYLARGIGGVKIKIGGATVREDVERVRVVRETIGPDAKLMVDANNAYTVPEAIAIARRMEPYDIYWFEEPVAPDDYRGHARVAESTIIPVATGENEYTRYGFRDLIELARPAVLNPGAQIMGGVTAFMEVAALAAAYDLPISPHGAPEIHVHLAAAINNGGLLGYTGAPAGPNGQPIFRETIELDEHGNARVPDRPGHGFTPNDAALEAYRA